MFVLLCVVVTAVGCGGRDPPADGPRSQPPSHAPVDPRRAALDGDDRAIDGVRSYTAFVSRGSAKSREIALTFDDGPGPTTPALIRFLHAAHVPATFFLVGRSVARHPDLVRRELDLGFSLGSHTEGHTRLRGMPSDEQEHEILAAADRITAISRHAVRLFRPPYGSWDEQTLDIMRAERMMMVLWSVDTQDYEATSARPIVTSALAGATPGAVILMHDGPGARPDTLTALRRIVPALRRRGYRLVSLPQLLRDDPPPRRQATPPERGG